MGARCPICDLPELDPDRVTLLAIVQVVARFVGTRKGLLIRLRGTDLPQVESMKLEDIALAPLRKC